MVTAWHTAGLEKLEGPSQSLILFDTQCMEAQIPENKLSRIRIQLATWLRRKKATKWEILSLVGLLQHATKVVRPGKIFVTRMYNTAARIKELHYYTTLTKAFKYNLHWWHFMSIVGMVSVPQVSLPQNFLWLSSCNRYLRLMGLWCHSLEITGFSMPGLLSGLQLV